MRAISTAFVVTTVLLGVTIFQVLIRRGLGPIHSALLAFLVVLAFTAICVVLARRKWGDKSPLE